MKRIYPWLVVLAGIAGAILRGTQLCYGYEKSGLPKDGYLALPVLTAVVLIGCLILSRFYRDARPFETTFYAPAPQNPDWCADGGGRSGRHLIRARTAGGRDF